MLNLDLLPFITLAQVRWCTSPEGLRAFILAGAEETGGRFDGTRPLIVGDPLSEGRRLLFPELSEQLFSVDPVRTGVLEDSFELGACAV